MTRRYVVLRVADRPHRTRKKYEIATGEEYNPIKQDLDKAGNLRECVTRCQQCILASRRMTQSMTPRASIGNSRPIMMPLPFAPGTSGAT